MYRVVAAFIVALLLFSPSLALARHEHANSADDAATLASCPTEGDAKSARVQSINVLKRRMAVPTTADVDDKVTLTALIAPGDDTARFDTNMAASVSGYVADVKVGGVESVNCHTHNPKYRDTHIELTLNPMDDSENKHVIVEVTPQWRQTMAAKRLDWSTSTLRRELLGRWIKVTGWLLFDEEHSNAAENTNPGGTKNWRATVWEIHPITAIQILPGKP